MTTGFVIILLVVLFPLRVRGGLLHNWLVERVALQLRAEGFRVATEHPCRLPDGRVDSLDVYARRAADVLACEIETGPQNVRVNVTKAAQLGLPLWIVVPNRRVRGAVMTRLKSTFVRPAGQPIQVLLLGQLRQALALCFPNLPFPNGGREKGKTNQSRVIRRPRTWKRTNNSHSGRLDTKPLDER